MSPNLKSPNPTQRVPDSPGQDGNRTQRKRDFDVQIGMSISTDLEQDRKSGDIISLLLM